MSRAVLGLREWLSPGSVRRSSVPPMDAGLRPNDLLDSARALVPDGSAEPDDVVLRPDGAVWFSSGSGVWAATGAAADLVAELGGEVGPLALDGTTVVAAVQGVGLVRVSEDGTSAALSQDEAVRTCVTDVCVLPDGSLLASVGSRRHARSSDWGRALLDHDRSGALVRVDGGGTRVVAADLPWPSGLAAAGDDVLVALSFEHVVERRPLSRLDRRGSALLSNLPFYPGRIRATDGGWWLTAPYLRNQASELVLDEPELCRDLLEQVAPGEWPLPRLRSENPYRDPLQLGQLRVLGVLKPWAPPRSYGLVALVGADGRVRRSFHSRVDGTRHGVMGVAARGEHVVVAARGAGTLLELGGSA